MSLVDSDGDVGPHPAAKVTQSIENNMIFRDEMFVGYCIAQSFEFLFARAS